MNILVTGGAGFIGSHFVLRHVERHPDDRVVVLDKLTYAADRSFLDPVSDRIAFVEGDITDQETVSRIAMEHNINTIVDFAAETHVDRSIVDATPFIHTNILGVQSLIDVCKASPQMLFLHVSTDEVYGDQKDDDPSRTPESPIRPGNPYSASKAAGDLLLLAAVHTFGIRARITRCTNNYGPHQADEKFIPTVIRNALKDQKIPVYGEGKQQREWLYVTDHTDAIERVLSDGKDGEVYHISADVGRPNIEIARMVLDLLQKSHNLIASVPDRPGHDWRYKLNSSGTRQLGWKPAISFEDGLKQTVAWYRKRYEKDAARVLN